MEKCVLSLLWAVASIASFLNCYLADSKDYTYAWGIWGLVCVLMFLHYAKGDNDKGIKEG